MLTELIGCSYDEAAAVCGCPVGTIRSRVARARADLDKMLAGPAASAAPRESSGGAGASAYRSEENT